MANIYPKNSNEFHNSAGEFKIFNALKKLSNDWYVFYSLNWNDKLPNGRVTWGEADFVIFNKFYGLLVVEVKSGGIKFCNGEWIQTRLDNNENYKMKNPFNQANRSKYKLIDEINAKLVNCEKCFVDKIVWFPSIDNIDDVNLPLEYDKNIVLTSEALNNPEAYLVRAFNYYNSKHFNNLSECGKKMVLEILIPEFDLIPSSSNIKEELNYCFYQLTNEQKKILDFIDSQDNVLIQGGAGTGKTFIAVEQARRLSNYGKVLFLCFNRFLYLHLSKNCKCDNVDYYNLHTFISKYSNDNFLLEKNIITAINKIHLAEHNYKYIIIDEAQDFGNNILKSIFDKFTTIKAKFYIFYDKNQLLYNNSLPKIFNEFDCKLTLTKNCRNTVRILSTVNSSLSIPIKVRENAIVGNMPQLTISETKEKILTEIENKISFYLNDGFLLDDIVILTLKTEDNSILHNINSIGKYKIEREKNADSILFTSVRKYKGLESNVAIIVDFDSNILNDEEEKRILYVATSRAKLKLDIFYLNNNNDFEYMSNMLNGNFNSIIKVSTKFKVIVNII